MSVGARVYLERGDYLCLRVLVVLFNEPLRSNETHFKCSSQIPLKSLHGAPGNCFSFISFILEMSFVGLHSPFSPDLQHTSQK